MYELWYNMKNNCICIECGKEFHQSPSRIAKGWGKYCSKKCSSTAKIKNVKCVCEHCGKEFHITNYLSKNRRFCSHSCRASQLFTKPPVCVNCDNCGIEFKIHPYKLDKNKLHFCSRKCDNEHRTLTHRGPSKESSAKSAASRTGKKREPFTEEHKQRIGDSHRGEKNWNWRGGISIEYCEKFNKNFKEYIRDKFNRRCFICSMPEDSKQRLSVHHIDYNKNSICNGKEWAFVPLCTSCHTKTNYNRWHWFNLLINYWAMNDEINLFGDN